MTLIIRHALIKVGNHPEYGRIAKESDRERVSRIKQAAQQFIDRPPPLEASR
ncbi:hypothetical protein [Hydrogenophaga crassostreae]|uniref:hypothetical protein n=1 Tax=Hydrogenophaga crassostreae TaxID=1763535 RepID=UPI0012F8E3E3|nr:hypothetical protein [Hydrogenophaga crassostreae]